MSLALMAPLPLSTASSRSVWIDEPTAGTGVGAPTSASRLS